MLETIEIWRTGTTVWGTRRWTKRQAPEVASVTETQLTLEAGTGVLFKKRLP